MVAIEVVADYSCHTGEGPLWHPDEQQLYWVDIPEGRLFRYDPATGNHEQCHMTSAIGGFTLQENGLLLFKDQGQIEWWIDGETTVVATIGGEGDSRFNDVIADPRGRVFCGTMPTDERPGRLYRIDTNGTATCLLDAVQLPNGMGFAPSRQHFYFTDSGASRIYRFDYDQSSGEISNRTTVVDVQDEEGIPDGLTVDTEGYLWSARWDGSCVVRYSPTGVEVGRIEFPMRKVSSITFAGPDYTDAYVTTALAGGAREEEGEEAGALFHLKPNIMGVPEFRSRIY